MIETLCNCVSCQAYRRVKFSVPSISQILLSINLSRATKNEIHLGIFHRNTISLLQEEEGFINSLLVQRLQ